MIHTYEVQNIIKSALEELDGEISKPTLHSGEEEPRCTVFSSNVEKDDNNDLIFTFKEDCDSEQKDVYKITVELIS